MYAPSASTSQLEEHDFRVALVCMPFGAADGPSIQIGLLKAIVERAGFPADTFHLNLELAARLTPAIYDGLCKHRGHMTGEWLFAVAAFGEDAPSDDESYFAAFPDEVEWAHKGGKDSTFLSALRHTILPEFIDHCVTMIDWDKYRVVGFTSTFQQNVACLALARRIKERHPTVQIVFGGANMEDEMGPEYVRAFPFIDIAVIGEGDIAFPALLRAIAAGNRPHQSPGIVLQQEDGAESCRQAPPVRDLNAQPTPDYDEYFERVQRLGLREGTGYAAILPFESSRGCWWGQKHHCTFCGLNGLGMAYRAKNAERTLVELSELARKYGITWFQATDNILDMKYVNDLFVGIGSTRTDYQFFYEVKANLTPEQLRTLHRGGVRWIQPGIESLSSHVLKLMQKGSTMLQNVRLLKWCRYYRIRVSWNLIWGFPGETVEDYRREREILRLISHLEPPGGCSRIWMERFSPYFVERDRFPIHDVRPESSYAHVYPGHVALDKVAYFFDYRMEDTVPDGAHAATRDWVQTWQDSWNSGRSDTLVYRRTSDAVFIDDHRSATPCGTHEFYGPLALIYECCSETMRTVGSVLEDLQTAYRHHSLGYGDVRDALDEFCRRGLMISEEGKYLGLALPTNPNW